MIYRSLGNTGFLVSRLCFGTLTIGRLQRDLTLSQGASLLKAAYEMGVNFYDTAELYGTYKYIKKAFSGRQDVVIAGRCYAYDAQTARQSLDKFLRETGRDRAEIFMLHEQESEHTLRGHREAIEYFLKKKQEGLIGAFGISTHFIAAVKAAMNHPEIEVLHPILNFAGVGIADGTRDEMEAAVRSAYDRGIGIYTMKSLGGGNLLPDRDRALSYIRAFDTAQAIAVGMGSAEEISYNAQYFSGAAPEEDAAMKNTKKKYKNR